TMTEAPLRVALLRSDSPHQLFLEAVLANRFDVPIVVIEPGSAQQARLRRIAGWSAWAWRGYQQCRSRITGRAARSRRWFAERIPPMATVPPRRTVGWINDPVVGATLARHAPDVTVVCGTTYLRAETLSVAGTVVNVHGGVLPWYRGNHGVFFAYAAGDFQRIGASLHLVSPVLDGGDLIEVVRPRMYPGDDAEVLYDRAVHDAALRLCELLGARERGADLPTFPQPPGVGRTYRHRDRTPGRELRLALRRWSSRHRVPELPAAVESGT
ncbi:MAG: formyltransferase family protein, partial [Actinomycetes bacterium]